MALHTTLWSPDTCGCSIEYSWDDAVSEDLRIHTLVAIARKGSEHADIIDATLFAVLVDESRRKNKVLDYLLQTFASKVGIVDPDSGVLVYKDGFEPAWNYSAARILQLPVVGLTGGDKKTLQTQLDLQFAPNKVKVI